ncbi:hypothetical protein [Pseudonocardia thermophila]|uniref:hypothetical protein n=1 Tax=Pseudonocardia thermophila TaxID=1848 RepID=UPI001160E4AD|nr:hypothetical protein [Pseudonocardia thermophila]
MIARALVASATGAMQDADALLTGALPAIEERGAPWTLAVGLATAGRIATALGDPARADRLLTRALRLFADLGDDWGISHQLSRLADIAAQRGDVARAAQLYGVVDAMAEQAGLLRGDQPGPLPGATVTPRHGRTPATPVGPPPRRAGHRSLPAAAPPRPRAAPRRRARSRPRWATGR